MSVLIRKRADARPVSLASYQRDLELRCPRCAGRTWLEWYGEDVVQRCLCGLFHYVERRVDNVVVLKRAVGTPELKLPQSGTKIAACLNAVAERFPSTIMTLDVAIRCTLNNKETAALMVVLSARGLIERVEERRGLSGGSIWKLTHQAARLLKLLGEDGGISPWFVRGA